MNSIIKFKGRYLFVSFLVISVFFFGCKDQKETNDTEKKEYNHEEIVKRKSKEQRYASHIAEIHKAEHYKSEAYVSFELAIELPELKDHVKIVKATDFSEFKFTSEEFGEFYIIGEELFKTESSKFTSELAKNYLEFAFIFGAFSELYQIENSFSEIEELEAFDNNFKVLRIESINSGLKHIPSPVTSLTDSRTDMIKALSMELNLTGEENLLYFDRYITVNRIPVSLTWKLFKNNEKTNFNNTIGEIKVSRIKYYSEGEFQLKIPEEVAKFEDISSI